MSLPALVKQKNMPLLSEHALTTRQKMLDYCFLFLLKTAVKLDLLLQNSLLKALTL